ncbi:hypothetical protein BDV26DRAFT_214424 [Aspergillus bertholletiae]|uniref:GPI anchored protein n=1 Tax=Aspergillus bertholletiae TaxID=1226010 RepID=A0A5N7B5J6_9EURO|nr:hypothetical protein BDV26DRAFT_214424 [Aspergillus bertholletiae]
MRFQVTHCLALLAAVTATTANDIVSFLYPGGAFASDAKLIGTTGGSLTTLAFNCHETATATVTTIVATRSATAPDDGDDDQCWAPEGGYTITAGSTTFKFVYTTPGYTMSAGCSFAGTTHVSCKAASTFISDTGIQSFHTSSSLTYISVTITETESAFASATASATSSSAPKTTASVTDNATLRPSDSSSASSTAETSSNVAMPLATGLTHWAAGSAAMILALVLA